MFLYQIYQVPFAYVLLPELLFMPVDSSNRQTANAGVQKCEKKRLLFFVPKERCAQIIRVSTASISTVMQTHIQENGAGKEEIDFPSPLFKSSFYNLPHLKRKHFLVLCPFYALALRRAYNTNLLVLNLYSYSTLLLASFTAKDIQPTSP